MLGILCHLFGIYSRPGCICAPAPPKHMSDTTTLLLPFEKEGSVVQTLLVPRELWHGHYAQTIFSLLQDSDFLQTFFFFIPRLRETIEDHLLLCLMPPRSSEFDSFVHRSVAAFETEVLVSILVREDWALYVDPSSKSTAHVGTNRLCGVERVLWIILHGFPLETPAVHRFYAASHTHLRLTGIALLVLYALTRTPLSGIYRVTPEAVCGVIEKEVLWQFLESEDHADAEASVLAALYRLTCLILKPDGTPDEVDEWWDAMLLNASSALWDRECENASATLDHGRYINKRLWRFMTCVLALNRHVSPQKRLVEWYNNLSTFWFRRQAVPSVDLRMLMHLQDHDHDAFHEHIFFHIHTVLNPFPTEDY